MNYWLIKSEAECYSIDDLKRDKKTSWEGVRNFQARNFMRDHMKIGDLALFYHSNSDKIGIVGIAKVCTKAHPDLSAFDKKNEHFDPKATKENPIWQCVDFEFVKKFSNIITLGDIKNDIVLKNMIVAKKGNRLSITLVSEKEYTRVLELATTNLI